MTTNTATNQRKDQYTREMINEILTGFDSNEEKRYWIGAMVKMQILSEMRAGQIIIERGL